MAKAKAKAPAQKVLRCPKCGLKVPYSNETHVKCPTCGLITKV